ncbi:MAG: GGDEF/response regulator receiver domain protein [Candidatus Ozemobacter sibiricus]|uniref:GGDEF/response regulator receiver domain protein n=1 Tax=Candidatus Ozemobacter sibiricus TaxID=2268124 RepID=A0A367ZDW7_9BACT|nr:MAG: GGDEF/response regulator receiver domain protein [Candidatus Ozemobacter sibiricus]
MTFRLQWKLSLVFGLLGVFMILTATWTTYTQAFEDFNKELADKLMALAALIEKFADPDRLLSIDSVHHPYYKEMKTFLRAVQKNFNVPWAAVYRYDGTFFTHIVDGASHGEEFIPEYPIFDVSPEMFEAWNEARPTYCAANVDAFGSWATAYYPVKNAEGKTIALIDVSKSNDRLDRFKQQIIRRTAKVAIGLTLLTLLVCFLFSGYLTNPIALLTDGARRIAAGNLQERITGISTRDEIGLLVETFNRMTDELVLSKCSLENKIHELSTLYEISQKTNFAGNTEEILKTILEKAVTGLKAERGSILLFNEDAGTLSLSVAYGGEFADGTARIEIKPGEGVAGRVFETREPLLVNQRELPATFKSYDPGIPWEVRNILCLPLMIEQRCSGVMNIINRHEGDFTKADLALGTTMANQIALTLEKSRLYELSITDGLTRLYVHRYFQVCLTSEIKRARRYAKQVSLILFDIDHFKKFNDTYGHQMGDIVLAGVAQILKASLRTVDIPARYGGEEFAVILPETDTVAAAAVAERIRKAVEKHDFPGLDGTIIKVTISLGVATFPHHANEKLDLIRHADEALYGSKKAGRNTVTVYQVPGGTSA